MKPYCFILCLGWCSLTLFSQPVTTLKTASRAAQKAYEDGVRHYQSNQYEKAGQSFRKALEKSPRFIDAAVQLASVCFDQEDHACAIQFFEQALQWDSTYQRKIYYTLALSQYRSDHFNAAAKNMKRFLSLETSNADLISKASQLLPNLIFADSAVRHPVPVEPDFIEPLNSDFSEYLPSLTADGKTAVFTRRSPNRDEDLYMSRQVDGKWTEAFPISALNTPLNEGSPAIAPDGLSLVFTSCDRKSSYGGCDLYQSHWKDNTWTEPYNLGDKINTPAYESQACFADNGKVLYFASNRKGSYGGFDLWYCFRKPDRSWSIPKNLGPVINSAGNEDCPFIHPNGAFLFFSSDAPPGMGGKDLFYSERNHETGQWGSPVNLGYPINSKGDESSFVVFPDGKTAWMASDQKYFQTATAQRKFNLDLYELKLPASLQIKPSTSVTIRILDRATDLPVQADVHIYDLSNDSTYHKSKAGPSGYLLISLTTGADYGLQVVHPKYVFVSDQFRCSEVKSQYDPMELMIYLDRVDSIPATAHILKNIFFESGSAVLRQESFFELDGMVRFLQDQARLRLKITGHTDHIGSEGDNEILSLKRAQAVIQYLTSKGINASRLLGEGKGESEPLASNETEAGRQMNRRIEFTIIQP